GVPVELVEVGKEPDLPRRAVADDVFMRAARQCAVGLADADAHAVRQGLDGERFRGAVALHRLDIEADDHARSVAPRIGGGKIAQEAASNRAALRLHADRLGHGKVAIALHHDVADEGENALLPRRRPGRAGDEEQASGDPAAGRHGRLPENATAGAAAALRSSSSKNGSGRNPSGPAIRLSGNDWMLIFRLRTAPL